MKLLNQTGGIIMKRIIAMLLVISILLVCTACQTDQDDVYSQAVSKQESDTSSSQFEAAVNDPGSLLLGEPSPEDRLTPIPGDTLSGELKIKYFHQVQLDHRVDSLAKEFMMLHPNVKITSEYGLGFYERVQYSKEEIEIKAESYYSNMRAEMAAGEADYLIFEDGAGLNLTSLSRSGILEDLAPYMEQDGEITEEKFYMPVLEAFQVEGKQTLLPTSFAYYSVYINRDMLEQIGVDPDAIETVTTEQLLDWYEQAVEINPELRLFYAGVGKDELFPIERTVYMDLEERSSNFTSPEFVDFLTRTSQVLNTEPNLSEDRVGRNGIGLADDALTYQAGETLDPLAQFWRDADPLWDDLITKTSPFFSVVNADVSQRNILIAQEPFHKLAGPYVFLNSEQELGVHAFECFAMPSSVKNKDLAWEFMKYCISERKDTRFINARFPWDYTDYIPVTKANWKQMVERVTGNGHFGTAIAGVADSFKETDPEQVMEDMEKVLSNPLVPIDYYNVDVQEYLDEFYVNELTTAEECAEKIQGRAEIWLNE
jgi:ABC-type glycerol-3-phosphate transport system substrate-binding protein